MLSILFLIGICLLAAIEMVILLFKIKSHRRRIRKIRDKKIQRSKMKHSGEHLAPSILVAISVVMLLVSLCVLFYELHILGIEHDPYVDQVIYVSGGLFILGVIWYFHHLQHEEDGWCKY